MKRFLHFLILVGVFTLFDSSNLFAQCDPGVPNCAASTITCLPFDGVLDDVINNSGSIPGCGGNFGFHNTSWYAIQVTSNTIGISIVPSNCQSSSGLQAGLYTDCDPNSAALGVQCACTTGGVNFAASGIPPGTYYIMLDGCSGDVCDFSINVTQGSVSGGAPADPNTPVVASGNLSVCPGEVVCFFTDPVSGASGYNWSFPGGVVPLNVDCNNACVIWGNQSGSVSVDAFNDCGTGSSMQSDVVMVESFTGMEFGEFCFPDEPGYFHQGTNTYYPGGTYVLPFITARGCDSTVTLEVTQYTGGIHTVNEQICAGESTCLIGGQIFSGPFNGQIDLQNAFGCDSTIIVDISVLSPVVSINAQAPGQINCQNQSQGLLLTANGSNVNTTYTWWTYTGLITSQVSDNQVFAGAGGRYYVSVTQTGAVGTECGTQPICTVIDSIDITESFNYPNVSTSGTDITCGGANDGTATVVINSGGVAPFTFAWDDPGASTDSTLTGLPAGTWHVTITSNDGCERIDSVTLIEPTTVAGAVDDATPTECNGASNGTATVSGSGGTSPYMYNIGSGNQATGVFNGLAFGSYTVTVTDDNGCSATVDVDIQQPTAVMLTEGFNEPSCNGGNDGDATITANGGTSPYMYDIGSGNQASNNFTGLAAGSYTVTVTDDNGCMETIQVDVTEPTAVSYTSAVVDANCQGTSTGTITITASGGNGPYMYDLGTGAQASNMFTGLAAGSYTVTVTDDNGCVHTDVVDVDQPAEVMLTEASLDVSCNGGSDGSSSITAVGGTPPFMYNIGTGDQTSTDFTGLSMGSYTVTVTDDNGCTQTIDVDIDEPTPISLGDNSLDASCNGTPDGETTISATGGTSPYMYNIGNGNVATPNFNGLAAGNYTVTVTDDNGCVETIPVLIGQPVAITLMENNTETSCNGGADGTATVSANGGTAPYNYNIGSGAQVTGDFSGLGSGNYIVTVTDDNGCVETINVSIDEPASITLTEIVNDATCFGYNDGDVTIGAVGGTAPFMYDIGSGATSNNTLGGLTAGNYTVTVTDDNGCMETIDVSVDEPAGVMLTEAATATDCNGGANGTVTIGATGGTSPYMYDIGGGATANPLFTSLSAGSYTVTVTDNNGCTVDIDVNIDEPTPISLGETSLDANCFGAADGQATISASGGTAPYMYDIGAGQVNNPNFNNLLAGNYDVTVTDDNGCTEIVSLTIDQPTAVTLSSSEQLVNCNGGSDGTTTITANGGTAPYMYDIGAGPTANNTINSLAAGNYLVTVTDDNGCMETIPVQIDEPAILTLAASGTDAECFNGNEGTAAAVASGGTPPYMYDIGAGPSASPNFGSLTAGSYTITVTDDNGCSGVASLNIDEPTELTVSGTGTETFCATSTDGTVTATGMGGTPPYMYSIDAGAIGSNPSFMNQTAGPHTIEITDANGCTSTTVVNVGSPTPIDLQVVGSDALCFGEGSGEATVTAMGGTGMYTYEWSDGLSQITPTAGFLMAGMYTVTVTDERGCTETVDVSISQPASALSSTGSSTDATCGASNGTITLSPSGGTAPYTYVWSNTATTQNLSNLDPGNFGYTITDANGCTFIDGVTVNTPSGLGATESIVDASCNGGADGTIDLNIVGGTTPYNIVWSNPIYNGMTSLTGLASGTYSVTITDDDGCEITSAPVVVEPSPLSLTITPSQASCGLSDGSINVLITGGTPDVNGEYSFDWSDDSLDGTEDPTGIPQGSYSVTITDANGCSITDVADVTVPNSPILSFTQVNVDCFGASTGSVELDVTGGEPPYTFDWSDDNYDGVEDPIAMIAGTYTLVVTDSKNCTDDIVVNITEPTEIEITSFSSMDATCGDANGSISITVQGGTGAYTYDWSDDNYDGTEDPAGLVPGNYFVTVTDNNGCSVTQDVSVSTPNGLDLVVDFQDASCFGGADGTIDLTINGGVAPFDVVWDNTIPAGTLNATNLPSGSYEVLVTDASGCEIGSNVTIDEPAEIQIVASVTDASCLSNDGAINLTVQGGTVAGDYTYQWDNGAASVQDPTGLGPNIYNVTVTDDNGCTALFSEEVIVPDAPIASVSSIDAQCFGAADGVADITVVGGEAPFNYTWSDPNIIGPNTTVLTAGAYTVTITDNQSCTDIVNITIAEPTALSVSGTSQQATCGSSNGSVDITTLGGTAPYTYNWSNSTNSEDPTNLTPGTYIVTITDAQGCELIENFDVSTPNALAAAFNETPVSCNTGDDGEIDITVTGGTSPYNYLWSNGAMVDDISGLTAGTYTLSVTDDDGCLITVSVNIDEPTPIVVSSTSTDATCNQANGTINLSVTGGTPLAGNTYTYQWDGGAGTSQNPTGLLSGNYNVTITDANGCTALHGQSVVQPNGVTLMTTPDDVNCNGGTDGSILVDISGGVGSVNNFQIAWSDPSIGSTNNPTGLAAGTYTITVTDEAGCNFTASSTVGEPPLLEAFGIVPTGASCNGGNDGSIDLEVSGGVSPYTYLWDNGAGINQDPLSLSAGTYNVTVTDANGCTALASETITEPAELGLTLDATDATCFGSVDGTLTSTVTGGTQPYSYQWTNNAGTDPNPANVPAGPYQLVVTDANGCTIDASISIAQPAMIEINITDESDNNGFNLSCSDATDGYVSVLAAGGNPPFSYAWNTGATGTSINNVAADTYEVIVTDAKGCTESLQVTLTAPEAISLNVQAVPPICFGDGNGFLFVEQVNGGTGPYVYSLDGQPFSSNPAFNNLHGGDYEVGIQDANGCAYSESIRIVEPEELTVELGNNFEVTFGDSTAEIRPMVSPANTILTDWEWLSGTACDSCFNLNIAPLGPTVYEFSVENDKGCIATDMVTVQVLKERLVYIPNAFSPNGDGVNDHFTIYTGDGVESIESFLIFDRWGEVVFQVGEGFESNERSLGWDGSLRGEQLNPGVFIYVAEIKFTDGEVIMYKGDVTLMGSTK